MIGRDSPGVGSYKYDYSKLMNKVLSKGNNAESESNYSFKKEKKFFEITQNITLK